MLQLSRGIVLFATRAEGSSYRIGSRFGHNPAYGTISSALETLADSGEKWLRAVADSDDESALLLIDNTQHYNNQRQQRYGRESKMIKGVTGTGVGQPRFSPGALDLDAWIAARTSGTRYSLTIEKLLSLIDYDHLNLTGKLHWADVLVSSFPQLSCYKTRLADLFSENARATRIPEGHRSHVQPLRSNGCDPAKTTEMSSALDDFFSTQLGQTAETWKRRVTFVGGDGGTYEMLLRLQKYLQTQETEYARLDWMVPVLQLWHAKWTALGRVTNNWWHAAA